MSPGSVKSKKWIVTDKPPRLIARRSEFFLLWEFHFLLSTTFTILFSIGSLLGFFFFRQNAAKVLCHL